MLCTYVEAEFAFDNPFKTLDALIKGIKTAFDEAGIEMLFPHRSVYFGKDIKPLNHK